ncbi:nitrite reductase [Knoellia sinensis KCTC 19936]|uniref:Nitrite reductase n=1 Tax=Knoellia sinensis KCTC 19936 TaxID=1385520 RepID=A0A0A0JGQ2_9MICO|nr:nitrite reductase small subunit NirD [Knoellia sinensis]KGN34806.1 nitrite reductase [Knoellia sinensis KCTC 19936]
MTIDVATESPALTSSTWIDVCRLEDLAPERGVVALMGGHQIAIFRTFANDVYAVHQRDPFSGAFVMSRGIVGTRGDAPTVASPMFKQVFDLRTGECLDAVGKEPLSLRTWPTRVQDGVVHVALAGADAEESP